MYTPPPKRPRSSSSNDTLFSRDTQSPRGSPRGDDRKQHDTDARHSDRYGHSKQRHYVKSHDQKRRSHTQSRQDPSKWTKYDLRDDGTKELAGLSAEQVNRKVAYQFLNQLKKSSEHKEEDLQDAKDAKIVFKRPKRSRDNTDAKITPESELNETGGNKERQNDMSVTSVRMMPEYVVGVSGGRKRQPSKTGSGSGSKSDDTKVRTKTSIVLSHLEDECDS